MAHHLLKVMGFGALHGKHRAALLTHRRQLGRITDKHQAGAIGVGALQGDLQQAAIHHRRLIHQHQTQVFERRGGLLGGVAALLLLLAAELETQQPMDGGGIPGGAQALILQLLTQHPHGFMGGCCHGPAEMGGIGQLQKAGRQKRLAGAGIPAEHKRAIRLGGRQPILKAIKGNTLTFGQFGRCSGQLRPPRSTNPAAAPDELGCPQRHHQPDQSMAPASCPPTPPSASAPGLS